MLTKITFRNQIREILYKQLTNGELYSGQRLNLADIARKLNTSVTPIREAFTQLEQVGIIESIPNVGFCIKALSDEEAKQTYNLIGVLEHYGVTMSNYSKKDLLELKKISNKIESCKNNKDRLILDNAFHEKLLKNFGNKIAMDTLQNLKTTVFTYELSFMEDNKLIKASNLSHDEIIKSLEQKRILEAANRTKKHWELSYDFISKINKNI